MPTGVPIDRQSIVVSKSRAPGIAWGARFLQGMLSGEFLRALNSDYCHPVRDDELELLRRGGQEKGFDSRR